MVEGVLHYLLPLLLLVGESHSIIQAGESAESALHQFENRLDYDALTPEIDTLEIEPEELRDCVETLPESENQCYPALTSILEDTCISCQRDCTRYNLSEFEHFDWINDPYYYDGSNHSRPNSLTSEWYSKIQLPDGTYGLVNTDQYEQNGKRGSNGYSHLTSLNLKFPGENERRSAMNGTITFRMHLGTGNIYQRGTGENQKCAELDLYQVSTHKFDIKLRCNKAKDNMDLWLNIYAEDNPRSILIQESVLNNDADHTVANSIHIAHVADTSDGVRTVVYFYINGKLVFGNVYSQLFTSSLSHRISYNYGLTGLIYNFYVYRQPLTQRLVSELYLKRHVPTFESDICYCPVESPVFVNTSVIMPDQPWRGATCSSIADVYRIDQSLTDREVALSEPVKRIQNINHSFENLKQLNPSNSWVSGRGSSVIIKITYKRFYLLKALALRLGTRPAEVLISTHPESVVIKIGKSCPPQSSLNTDPPCKTWSEVTLYEDLLLIDFQTAQRMDRLLIELNQEDEADMVPFIINSLRVFADCGCYEGHGKCVNKIASEGLFTCECDYIYNGTYCHECSDGYTLDNTNSISTSRTRKGEACIPCRCNTQGARNQICDKVDGKCECKDGIDSGLAGKKCHAYVDSITPKQGPAAGGTDVTVGGKLLQQVLNITIAGVECEMDVDRSSQKLYCTTGRLYDERDILNKPQPVTLVIQDTSLNSPISYPMVMTSYTYNSNPNITLMNRISTIVSGGIDLVFEGTNLQAVPNPLFILNLNCKKEPNRTVFTHEQSCSFDTRDSSNKKYVCQLPSVEGFNNYTTLCTDPDTLKPSRNRRSYLDQNHPSALSRNRREAELKVQDVIDFWPGLKLDGYKRFSNLSDVSWLPMTGALKVKPNPVIKPFSDESGIRYIKKPPNKDAELIIDGKHLNSVLPSDYIIRIGLAKHHCTSPVVTDTTILCFIDILPEANKNDENAPEVNGEKLPLVQVQVAHLPGVVNVGYVYLERPAVLTDGEIAGIVVALVGALVIVTVVLLLLRRHQIKKRRDMERAAMNGFQLVDFPNNTLQMQVEAILVSENLNDVLLAHIIPSTYVTQESIIGQGHFGQVCKGKLIVPEVHVNKTIAIKSLKKDAGLTPIDVVNFVKEALLMKDFNHINVLPLLGIVYNPNDIESLPLVITPYMENGDLKTLVSDERNEFTAGDLLHFGLQISAGMTYLSNAKFIHRDLRAANCMVDSMLIVKVGDFGLSHDISDRDYYRPQDKSKPLPVKWMALEVLASDKYTTKSDVWSYGVLLWELMTRGFQPYADVQNSQIKNYIMNGHRLPKPDLVPEQIYDIMVSCWRTEPEIRPAFSELTHTISQLLKQANGSSTGYQRDYTSPLMEFDDINPDTGTASQLQKFDEWSAIIPLIKAQGEDYADTGRIGDDEQSDSSDDEDGDSAGESSSEVDVGFSSPSAIHCRTKSLTRELERINSQKRENNDYGVLINGAIINPEQRTVYAADDTLLYAGPTMRARLSSGGSEVPPPIPDRIGHASLIAPLHSGDDSAATLEDSDFEPERRRSVQFPSATSEKSGTRDRVTTGSRQSQVLKTQSSPIPHRHSDIPHHRNYMSLKIPVHKNPSSSSTNDSVVYEEACVVIPEASQTSTEQLMPSRSKVIPASPPPASLPPASPPPASSLPTSPPTASPSTGNNQTGHSTTDLSQPEPALATANLSMDGYLEFTSINEVPPPTAVATPEPKQQFSKSNRSVSLSTSKSKAPKLSKGSSSLENPLTSLKRSISKQSSGEEPPRNITLSTKVPVMNKISISSSLGEQSSIEEGTASSTPHSVSMKKSHSTASNSSELTAMSSVAPDGYLEFDSIGGDSAFASPSPTSKEPKFNVEQTNSKHTSPLPSQTSEDRGTSSRKGRRHMLKRQKSDSSANGSLKHKGSDFDLEAITDQVLSQPSLKEVDDEQSSIDQPNSTIPATTQAPVSPSVSAIIVPENEVAESEDVAEPNIQSDDSSDPKPVARIRPMARNEDDLSVTMPTNRTSKEKRANQQPAYMNFEGLSKAKSENLPTSAEVRRRSNKAPLPTIRTSLADIIDDKSTPKLQVDISSDQNPVVSNGVSTLRRDVNPRHREVASSYENTSTPVRQMKPNASPNTRRRQIQEALNAQVPSGLPQMTPNNQYENLGRDEDREYENALDKIHDKRRSRDLTKSGAAASAYENVHIIKDRKQ